MLIFSMIYLCITLFIIIIVFFNVLTMYMSINNKEKNQYLTKEIKPSTTKYVVLKGNDFR